MFWFFGPKACGILAPRPGIKPAPPALEGEVLTTGLPGRSLNLFFDPWNGRGMRLVCESLLLLVYFCFSLHHVWFLLCEEGCSSLLLLDTHNCPSVVVNYGLPHYTVPFFALLNAVESEFYFVIYQDCNSCFLLFVFASKIFAILLFSFSELLRV